MAIGVTISVFDFVELTVHTVLELYVAVAIYEPNTSRNKSHPQ